MRSRLSSLIAKPTMPTLPRLRCSSATAMSYGSACSARTRTCPVARPRRRLSLAFETFGDHHVVPAADELDLGERLLLDASADDESPSRARNAPVLSVATPDGEEIRQSRLIRDVRIAIERGVAAGGARRRDARERGVELVPVARALRLEMRDL